LGIDDDHALYYSHLCCHYREEVQHTVLYKWFTVRSIHAGRTDEMRCTAPRLIGLVIWVYSRASALHLELSSSSECPSRSVDALPLRSSVLALPVLQDNKYFSWEHAFPRDH
jgi:hypothetical protein